MAAADVEDNPFALTPEVAHEDKEFFESMTDRFDQTIRVGDRVDTIDGQTGIVNMLWVPADGDAAMVDVVDVWWNELGEYNANQVWLHTEDFVYSDWGFTSLNDMKDVPVGSEVVVPPMFNGDGTTWEVLVSKAPFAKMPGWTDYTFETAGTFTHFDANELIVSWRLSKRGTALAAEVGAVVDADAAKAEQDREEEQNREDTGDWSGVVGLAPIAETKWVQGEDATLVSPSGDHIWTGIIKSIARNGDVEFVTNRDDGSLGTEVTVNKNLLDSGWQLLKGVGLFSSSRTVTYYEKPKPFGGVPLPPLDAETEPSAQVAATETPVVTALGATGASSGAWSWDSATTRQTWADWKKLRRRLPAKEELGEDYEEDLASPQSADSLEEEEEDDAPIALQRPGTPEVARVAHFQNWDALGGDRNTSFALTSEGLTVAGFIESVYGAFGEGRARAYRLDEIYLPNDKGPYDPAEKIGEDRKVIVTSLTDNRLTVAIVFNYANVRDMLGFDIKFHEQWRVLQVEEGIWALEFQDRSTSGTKLTSKDGKQDYMWDCFGYFADPNVRAARSLLVALTEPVDDTRVRAHAPLQGPCLPVWAQMGRWLPQQWSGKRNQDAGYGHDYNVNATRAKLDEALGAVTGQYVGTDGSPVTKLAQAAFLTGTPEPKSSWVDLKKETRRNPIYLLGALAADTGLYNRSGDGIELGAAQSSVQTMLFSPEVGTPLRDSEDREHESYMWAPNLVERYLVVESSGIDFHLLARDLIMNQPAPGHDELGGVWSKKALDIIFGHSYVTSQTEVTGVASLDDEKQETVDVTVEWPVAMHRAIDLKRTKMGLLQLRKLQYEAMINMKDIGRDQLSTLLVGKEVEYSVQGRQEVLNKLYRAMHNQLWRPRGLNLNEPDYDSIHFYLSREIAEEWQQIDQWVANAEIACRVCHAWEESQMSFSDLTEIDDDDQTMEEWFDWITNYYQPNADGTASANLAKLSRPILSVISQDFGGVVKIEPSDEEGSFAPLYDVISAPAVAEVRDVESLGSNARENARDRVLAWNNEYGFTQMLRKLSMTWSDVLRANLSGEAFQVGALGQQDADIFTVMFPKVQTTLRFLERTGMGMNEMYEQLDAPLDAGVQTSLVARQDALGVIPRHALAARIANSFSSALAEVKGSGGGMGMIVPIAVLTLMIALARRSA